MGRQAPVWVSPLICFRQSTCGWEWGCRGQHRAALAPQGRRGGLSECARPPDPQLPSCGMGIVLCSGFGWLTPAPVLRVVRTHTHEWEPAVERTATRGPGLSGKGAQEGRGWLPAGLTAVGLCPNQQGQWEPTAVHHQGRRRSTGSTRPVTHLQGLVRGHEPPA